MLHKLKSHISARSTALCVSNTFINQNVPKSNVSFSRHRLNADPTLWSFEPDLLDSETNFNHQNGFKHLGIHFYEAVQTFDTEFDGAKAESKKKLSSTYIIFTYSIFLIVSREKFRRCLASMAERQSLDPITWWCFVFVFILSRCCGLVSIKL